MICISNADEESTQGVSPPQGFSRIVCMDTSSDVLRIVLALQPAELCAERSSCEGPGLSQAQAGEPTCFKVTTRDRFGNLQTAGGDDVSVQVASAAGDNRALVTGSVSDMGRGSYKVGTYVKYAQVEVSTTKICGIAWCKLHRMPGTSST